VQHSLENALLVNHEAATNLMTLKQLLNETLQTVSTVLLIVKNWTLSKSLVTILLLCFLEGGALKTVMIMTLKTSTSNFSF